MVRDAKIKKIVTGIAFLFILFQSICFAQISKPAAEADIKKINPVNKPVYISRQHGGSTQTADYLDGLFFISRGSVLSIFDQAPDPGVEAKKLIMLDRKIETVTVSKQWIIVTCSAMESEHGATTIIANDPVNDFPVIKKLQHDFTPTSAIAREPYLLIGGELIVSQESAGYAGVIEFHKFTDGKTIEFVRREFIPYPVKSLDIVNSMLAVGTSGTTILYPYNPDISLKPLYDGIIPTTGGIMMFQDAVYFIRGGGIAMMALPTGRRPETIRTYIPKNALFKAVCAPEGIYLGEIGDFTNTESKEFVCISRINHALDQDSYQELARIPAYKIYDMTAFPQGLLIALGDNGVAILRKKEDGAFAEPTIEKNPNGTQNYASWQDNTIFYNDAATLRLMETSYSDTQKNINSRNLGFCKLPFSETILNASESGWIRFEYHYDSSLQKSYINAFGYEAAGESITQSSFELPVGNISNTMENLKKLGTWKSETILSFPDVKMRDTHLCAVIFKDSVFNPQICDVTISKQQTIYDLAFIDANTFLLLEKRYSENDKKYYKGIGIYGIDQAQHTITGKKFIPLPVISPDLSAVCITANGKWIIAWEESKTEQPNANYFHVYSITPALQETYLGSFKTTDITRHVYILNTMLWLCGTTDLTRCDLTGNLEQWDRFTYPNLAVPLPFETDTDKFWISSVYSGFIELSEKPGSTPPIIAKPDPDIDNEIPGWQRVQRIAGLGIKAVTEGAHPLKTALQSPDRMVRTKDGRLFVAESASNQVLEIIPDKSVRVIFSEPYNPNILFEYPMGLALSADETKLYISNSYSNMVKALNLNTGIVEEIAGTGNNTYNGDNLPGNQTNLDAPTGIAITDDNRVIIAEARGQRIRMILQDGTAHVLAGAHDSDNPGREVKLEKGAILNSFVNIGMPADLISFHNTIFFSSFDMGCVFKMDLSEANLPAPHNMTVIAGGIFGRGDEYPDFDLSYYLRFPEGITVTENARLLVCDTGNWRILETDLDGNFIADFGGVGPGNAGDLMPYCYMRAEPSDACSGQDGTIYFCDPNNNVIRAITGKPVFTKDITNPEDSAVMNWPLF